MKLLSDYCSEINTRGIKKRKRSGKQTSVLKQYKLYHAELKKGKDKLNQGGQDCIRRGSSR